MRKRTRAKCDEALAFAVQLRASLFQMLLLARGGSLAVVSGLVVISAACRSPTDARRQDTLRLATGDDPYLGSKPGEHCARPEQESVLVTLNRLRTGAGALPLRCLEPLAEVAEGHANYLAANEDDASQPHAEEPDRSPFHGRTIGERARAAGLEIDSFWLSEGVSRSYYAQSVLEIHLNTVYHRAHLLSPSARYFGFAAATGTFQYAVFVTMAHIDSRGLKSAVFPRPLATDVPLAFTPEKESPNPLPNRASVGLPISVHLPRRLEQSGSEPCCAEAQEFTLRELKTDQAVPASVINARQDAHIFPSDVYLLPLEPLKPVSRYEAHALIQYAGDAVERRWQFTTGDVSP